ncbi:DALR anticodon-binding domain-containing protein, partial [Salmonella enterica]|uniref:DALR anticodon-binding domain-containing protein n=1 Tax=Salmonella enterica TaxID=28901 RepID=UPI00329844DE
VSLAAANKRIANILRKSAAPAGNEVSEAHLAEEAERKLFERLVAAEGVVKPAVAKRDYVTALEELARLKDTVDRFFDSVMVMTEDDRLRNNRLGLLARLRSLFLEIADV